MEQCPACMRYFSSPRYLMSHLNQGKCHTAFLPTYPERGGTNNSPLHGGRNDASIDDNRFSPSNDTILRPITLNPFGDIILAEDNEGSDGFPLPDEMEDMDDHMASLSTPPQPADETQGNTNTGQEVPTENSENISTIHENESFNVPFDTSNDKLLPMLKMISAVRAVGAPLNLLDTLVKIIKDEWKVGRLDISHLCTHKTAMRRISKLFPLLPVPIPVTITHERTIEEMSNGAQRHIVTFPKFSFLAQFQDLLDDHVFSELQNLVVDPENPWDYYKRNSCPHSTDEIQDGDWFQSIVQAAQTHAPSNDSTTGPFKDFLFGIQGYVDKTGTDAHLRTGVEPLVITLTLFTNTVRNSDKYWRVLALLPSSLCQKQRKKHSFGASVRNYHIALKEVLSELIDLQKKPPIVRLRLGNQFQQVRARFYWVNTIADGLANEALTGRIQNRHSSPRLSRGCHCPLYLSDESSMYCKFMRQAAIERLTVAALGPPSDNCPEWDEYVNSLQNTKQRRAAESALKTRKKIAQAILQHVFGQHVVDLVWFHVDQGPNPRGCFGSTPVDPMHAFEEGIVPNIMSVIIDPMSESIKSRLDALAINIVACNRWDPDYPRMNFSGGFSSLTQLTADEKVGKMMLFWIITQTTLGHDILEKRSSPSFDAQRVTFASRFAKSDENDIDDDQDDGNDESSIESTTIGDHLGDSNRIYTGTIRQLEMVDRCLHEHGLQYVIPWTSEMIPFHQELLRKTVFHIHTSKGKGTQHILPAESFLDRYVVNDSDPTLYTSVDMDGGGTSTGMIGIRATPEARYSIDSTAANLTSLLEMLLAFHASYKYGMQAEMVHFDMNVRLMMKKIKEMIHRGNETKRLNIRVSLVDAQQFEEPPITEIPDRGTTV